MGIEAKINYQLNKVPALKRIVKRVYQRGMYALLPKLHSEGEILRVSPDDPESEYFFGYYDKSPWDATDRYMLCLKAKNTWSDVSPKESAQIILIDTQRNNHVTLLGETHAWNVQQGCMLQWLGPDFHDRVLYNDFRDGRYCSVILKLDFKPDGVSENAAISVHEDCVIPAPVYSVDASGRFALTLDFSRLYRLRPGYGYYNLPEATANEKLPDAPAIWRVDLETGEISVVLKYTDFANFEPRLEMNGAEHKVNHIMLSPNGKRFMVLYRWFNGQRKYTRLVTCNVDGTEMYNLSDDDMVSHCCWKDDEQIFAFENKQKGGNGYYLMRDKSRDYVRFWPSVDYDGHPSYSPDRSRIVFDRYPDRARVAAVMMCDAEDRQDTSIQILAKVFAPFKYDNDVRCDLHPRWNRAGDAVCFDSVFEGHRGLYVVRVPEAGSGKGAIPMCKNTGRISSAFEGDQLLLSVIIPLYNAEKYLFRCVDSVRRQSYKNLEIILVDDGSTDNCGAMCDQMATQDNRIKVIHKANGGQSSARNDGLNVANGEYITFVDSDDWIEPDTYQYTMGLLLDTDADVADVDCQFAYADDDVVPVRTEKIECYRGQDVLWHFLYRGITIQNSAPYSCSRKVYARKLIGDMRFRKDANSEDMLFNYQVLKHANVIVVSNQVKYHYFQNSAGISLGPLRKRDLALLTICEEMCAWEKDNSYRDINQLTQIKLARSYFSILARIATSGVAADIENPKHLTQELTRKLREYALMLMKAPIAFSRKVLIALFCVDYRIVSFPYQILRRFCK